MEQKEAGVWDKDRDSGEPGAVSGPRSVKGQNELNEKDTERLNWLDAQKVKHSAHWDGKSGFGNSAWWVNPSVSWTVSQSVEDETYEIPQVLEQMSIREAIDLAMGGKNK